MQTRTLANTELTVSRACFGTMTFGAQVDESAARKIVDYCFDNGINFLDTANVYNRGESERVLGKCIKGVRKKIILASKVRGKMGDGPDEAGLSHRAIVKAVDETLQRLQTDYLDIYYLHQPDYDVPIEESLKAMEMLVQAGKVRYPASSNYSSWQVAEMLWIADKKKRTPAWITQPMYNLLARGIEQEYLPMARRFGVSTCVYNPLAGGLLTGKQKRDAPAAGTRFDKNQMYLDRYWHPAYLDAVDELKKVADAAGRSMVSLALNWLLYHTAIDCVILGASKLEQLKDNIQAMSEGPLPADTLAACDRVWENLRGVTPKYNR